MNLHFCRSESRSIVTTLPVFVNLFLKVAQIVSAAPLSCHACGKLPALFLYRLSSGNAGGCRCTQKTEWSKRLSPDVLSHDNAESNDNLSRQLSVFLTHCRNDWLKSINFFCAPLVLNRFLSGNNYCKLLYK